MTNVFKENECNNMIANKSTHSDNKVNLPSSVFETNIEEKTGLLNKITPELGTQLRSYDPDIIAALDDDFDFDNPNNQLEDDFIELANKNDSLEIDSHCFGNYFSLNFNNFFFCYFIHMY